MNKAAMKMNMLLWLVIIKQSDNYLELSILLYGNHYQHLWTIILQKV